MYFSMPEKLSPVSPTESEQDMCESRSPSHTRAVSEDNSVDMPSLARRSPGIALALKRSGSDSLQTTRPRSGDGNSFSIGEQTQLLLRKMLVLEKKVLSMETQLKEEQLQRLHLEAKVVKLEEENQALKQNRELAQTQLQDFADLFYAATEGIRLGSGSISPVPRLSVVEMRMKGSITPSRRDSASSGVSIFSRDSVGSRLSGISISSQT